MSDQVPATPLYQYCSTSPEEEDRIFETSTSIRVKKGDLLGLYSAAIYIGSSRQTPNFSYILYDGDLITGAETLKCGEWYSLIGAGYQLTVEHLKE